MLQSTQASKKTSRKPTDQEDQTKTSNAAEIHLKQQENTRLNKNPMTTINLAPENPKEIFRVLY